MVRLNCSILFLAAVTIFTPQVVAAASSNQLAGSSSNSANPNPPKVIDTFCGNFDRSCADTCLKGKVGKQKIAYVCSKVPPKNKIYHFACHCNGKDKTQAALNKVAGPHPSTVTTTTSESVTSTQTVTSILTEPTTVTLPFETDSVSIIGTVTEYTVSNANVGKQEVQKLQVAKKVSLVQVEVAKKATTKKPKKTQTTFCKEYSSACGRQCARVKSTTKNETCKKTKDGIKSDSYNLYCKCKNGKLETQHALADIGNDGASTETVTVVGTTVETETETSTVTIPVTATSTSYTTTNYVVSTTTVVVLAPTGVVRAEKGDKKIFGYVGKGNDQQSILGVYSPGSPSVSSVFLVEDEKSGNYEIGFSLQPERFWKFSTQSNNGDFKDQSTSTLSVWSHLGQGNSISPPSISDQDFSQTFSWKLGSIGPNPHVGDSSITSPFQYDLNPRWIQRDGNLVDLSVYFFGQLNANTGLFAAVPGSAYGRMEPYYYSLNLYFEQKEIPN